MMADNVIAILLSTGHTVVCEKGGRGITDAHLEAIPWHSRHRKQTHQAHSMGVRLFHLVEGLTQNKTIVNVWWEAGANCNE